MGQYKIAIVEGVTIDGIISFRNQNLYAQNIDPVEVHRRIGMVFQNRILFRNPFIRKWLK